MSAQTRTFACAGFTIAFEVISPLIRHPASDHDAAIEPGAPDLASSADHSDNMPRPR